MTEMSVSKYTEAKLQAQRFEELLNEEIANVENLMKPPTEPIRMKTLTMMTAGEAIETGDETNQKGWLIAYEVQ